MTKPFDGLNSKAAITTPHTQRYARRLGRALKMLMGLESATPRAVPVRLYREEFEHSLKRLNGLMSLPRLPSGEYADPHTQASWLQWKRDEQQKDFKS
ncbi:hypothetical protein [Pseudomonas sp. HS6]|uniref:hypothetical protein n=1 Tax=Pseudomonas sp. HS6 TaxID=2850559 RepID=UPI002019E7AB|nr:hypothetical protein [Pseudomonas sp. HS6]UQS14178.1 hypothetical protein JJN09_23620 [Pseudomonas sp. HS6]